MKILFSSSGRVFHAILSPLVILVLAATTLNGCRKEDSEFPVLNVQILAAGSTFDYGESIPFSISASDDRGLQQVGVVVLNESGIPVLSAVQTNANGNTSYSWTSSVEHLNPYVITGNYTARFFADDGSNITYAFRTITLNTLPLELEKVLLLEPQPGSTQVSKINASGEKIFEENLDIEVRVASSDNRTGQLVIGGLQWEGIYLMDKNFYTVNFQIPTPSLSSPELFNSMVYHPDNNRHYIACHDGLIREIGPSSITSVMDLAGWIPGAMMISGAELFVALADVTGIQHAVGIVNINSGQLVEILETDIDVKAILNGGANDHWVLGNLNEMFVVRKLNAQLPSLYDPDGINGPSDTSPVSGALILPSGNWLVQQSSGCRIYPGGGSGSGVFISAPASSVVYEPIQDVLYLALENEILAYRENIGALASISHDGNVAKVVPVYNK